MKVLLVFLLCQMVIKINAIKDSPDLHEDWSQDFSENNVDERIPLTSRDDPQHFPFDSFEPDPSDEVPLKNVPGLQEVLDMPVDEHKKRLDEEIFQELRGPEDNHYKSYSKNDVRNLVNGTVPKKCACSSPPETEVDAYDLNKLKSKTYVFPVTSLVELVKSQCRIMRSILVNYADETEIWSSYTRILDRAYYVNLGNKLNTGKQFNPLDDTPFDAASYEVSVHQGEHIYHEHSCFKFNTNYDVEAVECEVKMNYTCKVRPFSHYHYQRPHDDPIEFRSPSQDWLDSFKYCNEMDGSLPTMKSLQEEKTFITAFRRIPADAKLHVSKGFWIGLHDMDGDGKWQYTDGDHLNNNSYTNWEASHEEVTEQAPGRCAYVNVDTEKWRIIKECNVDRPLPISGVCYIPKNAIYVVD